MQLSQDDEVEHAGQFWLCRTSDLPYPSKKVGCTTHEMSEHVRDYAHTASGSPIDYSKRHSRTSMMIWLLQRRHIYCHTIHTENRLCIRRKNLFLRSSSCLQNRKKFSRHKEVKQAISANSNQAWTQSNKRISERTDGPATYKFWRTPVLCCNGKMRYSCVRTWLDLPMTPARPFPAHFFY